MSFSLLDVCLVSKNKQLTYQIKKEELNLSLIQYKYLDTWYWLENSTFNGIEEHTEFSLIAPENLLALYFQSFHKCIFAYRMFSKFNRI